MNAREVIQQALQNAERIAPHRHEIKPSGLARFSLKGRSEDMRKGMKEQVEVLPHLALLGQWTVFYAEPNAGKTLLTLWMLRESIKAGVIDGDRVFYLNCDDTYRGLVNKLEFAEEVGFNMMADGQNDFRSSMLLPELQRMAKDGEASGTVIVLDTLKKFIGLMDKAKQTEANKAIRAFVMAGGTVIALAHVNKHRGDDGALVYQGTTDQLDDADCGYTLDVVARHESRAVTFHNLKARGDVASTYGLEYRSGAGMTWRQKLDSVQPMDGKQIADAEKADKVAAALERNAKLIDAIRAALADGPLKRTELVAAVRDYTAESRTKVVKVLDGHTGARWGDGHRWTVGKGADNATIYTTLEKPAFCA